ncbi:hypothetical protein V1511DRAFT_236909 [Dipodascopsis uninucleata]
MSLIFIFHTLVFVFLSSLSFSPIMLLTISSFLPKFRIDVFFNTCLQGINMSSFVLKMDLNSEHEYKRGVLCLLNILQYWFRVYIKSICRTRVVLELHADVKVRHTVLILRLQWNSQPQSVPW